MLEWKWNFELPLIFLACILRVNPGTVETKKIKQLISQCLDLWESGKVESLVAQTEGKAMWSARWRLSTLDEESKARHINSLVLAGKLHSAVQNLTSREGGGIRATSDTCMKRGENIVVVLQAKQPPLREPDLGSPDCLTFEE